jgi:hypothetical protein
MLNRLIPAAALAAAALLAQSPPPPTGFKGTIEAVSGDTVTLKDKDGRSFLVQMTPGWTVSVLRKADLAAITPGSFVATNNVAIDATSGRSTELRVLEPGYRPEEGTHQIQGQTNYMTHGTVKSVARSDEGAALEVTYTGGGRRIVVPPNVPVTVSDVRNRSVLKPGTPVESVTRKGADGVPRAGRLVLSQ